MRIAIALLFVGHGLISLFGFVKAFNLADVPQLTEPIPPTLGSLWLLAAVLCVAAAAAMFLSPRWWWAVGAAAVAVSQIAIVTSWSDAKVGTVANLLLAVAVGYGFASRGPLSLRAAYGHHLQSSWPAVDEQLVTETDLEPLPDPVRRYLLRAGVVGRARVNDFRLGWVGRIRSGPDAPWMTFTADQLNIWDPPRRFFWMDARMKGLPVDVLHEFDHTGASMRVRLLSVRSMVDASGSELTRAETVTIFNDLCLYAPGALPFADIVWQPIDAHRAAGRFTLGANTVAAELTFDDDGDLIDFSSDDRAQGSADGSTFTALRWTTPVRDYAVLGPARVPSRAETRWHPASGAWTYGEFTLTSLAYNVAPRYPRDPVRPARLLASRRPQ
jgi:hypothetical protein